MIYYDILWYIMIYYDILWYIMIYIYILWYIMIYYDILWYIMIYYDILLIGSSPLSFCLVVSCELWSLWLLSCSMRSTMIAMIAINAVGPIRCDSLTGAGFPPGDGWPFPCQTWAADEQLGMLAGAAPGTWKLVPNYPKQDLYVYYIDWFV